MYRLYNIDVNNNWKFVQEIKLFGHNTIVQILGNKYKGQLAEPLEWHITSDDLEIFFCTSLGLNHKLAVVVDLKPKQENNVSLYRITDIWGYSCCGWTPIMLRLETLFVDEALPETAKEQFVYPGEGDVVYTFLYVNGSVDNQEISGKWTLPGRSSTNSALLWPDALIYFNKEIFKRNPEMLGSLFAKYLK